MQSAMVPPGHETGVYYIPICNLPFDTTWKMLKEWLCCECDIDYVQLFAVSTSGWIRVIGSHNFYRACDRLEAGVFNGRRIMYDGRNVTSSVLIKDVLDSNASPVSAPKPRQSSSYTAQPDSYSYGPPSEVPYDLINSTTQLSLATAQYAGFPSAMQETHVSRPRAGYPEDAPIGYFSHDAPPQFVAPEHRKVIVKRIGHSVSDDQVKTLIKQSMERVTQVKAELQRIEVPRGPNNQARGHVFATFRTADTARRVAEALDGKTWNSRRLEARLTNEGIAEESAADSRVSRGSDSGSRQRRSNESNRKKRTSDKTTTPAASGSSSRSSGESSSRQSRNQQPVGPIIADGSSRGPRPDSKESKRR